MYKINWDLDIEQLKTQLPEVHRKKFAKNNPEFYRGIEKLKQTFESLRMYEIILELAKIVATIKDAHTAVMLPQIYRLPFECYVFSEGIYITETNEENKSLINCEITAIENIPIKDILKKLTEIIPHENMQFVLSAIPNALVCADILYGLNIMENPQNVLVTLQGRSGEMFQSNFSPMKYTDYRKYVRKQENPPLYRQNADQFYWSNYQNGIYYINYNKCKDMPNQTVASYCESLKCFIENNQQIEKIVIDLRNNLGGNSELFSPFLKWLVRNEMITAKKTQLHVIVGRDTFSSALLNTYRLKFESNAIFVGEPTGGKPNCYGEVKYLELESSGLIIRYSTKYYHIIEDDNQLSFLPDVYCDVSFEDYTNCKDPCMEFIKNKK